MACVLRVSCVSHAFTVIALAFSWCVVPHPCASSPTLAPSFQCRLAHCIGHDYSSRITNCSSGPDNNFVLFHSLSHVRRGSFDELRSPTCGASSPASHLSAYLASFIVSRWWCLPRTHHANSFTSWHLECKVCIAPTPLKPVAPSVVPVIIHAPWPFVYLLGQLAQRQLPGTIQKVATI